MDVKLKALPFLQLILSSYEYLSALRIEELIVHHSMILSSKHVDHKELGEWAIHEQIVNQ